jgi:hypothetical protein
MSEIDMGNGMASRQKSFQARVELALHPERPDPIAVRLNRQCVQQPPQLHPHSNANEILWKGRRSHSTNLRRRVEEGEAFRFIIKLDELPEHVDGIQKLQAEILDFEKGMANQSFQKFR